MDNTKVIVGGSEVTGNIGSCSVKETKYYKDSFHTGVILQDTCSGKIVGRYEYYDWSYVYFPAVLIVIILSLFIGAKILFD